MRRWSRSHHVEAVDGRQWLVRSFGGPRDESRREDDRLVAGSGWTVAGSWVLVVVSIVVAVQLTFPTLVDGLRKVLQDAWGTVALLLLLVIVLAVARYRLRRPRFVTAEDGGWPDDYDSVAESWLGVCPGFTPGENEVRAVIRRLRSRGTPGAAGSPMRPT